MNPYITALQGTNGKEIDWSGFKSWLIAKDFSPMYISNCVGAAKRNIDAFRSGRLSSIVGSEKIALRGLSNLSKYLGCYSKFKTLLTDSGLHWNSGENADWAFFDLWNCDLTSTYNWLNDIKAKLGYETWWVFSFQLLTGMRTGEAINSLNLIAEHGLDNYLDKERLVLQHFKFRQIFLRRTKKVFFSVVTEDMVKALASWNVKVNYVCLAKRLEYKGLAVRTYDCRKLWGTRMREQGIPTEIIDMCQGRIATSLFQKHYFRPDIKSMLDNVRQGVRQIETMIGLQNF